MTEFDSLRKTRRLRQTYRGGRKAEAVLEMQALLEDAERATLAAAQRDYPVVASTYSVGSITVFWYPGTDEPAAWLVNVLLNGSGDLRYQDGIKIPAADPLVEYRSYPFTNYRRRSYGEQLWVVNNSGSWR
jgi:hypothetical protein